MTFIGIVSDSKFFDNVKDSIKNRKFNLIHITKKSIGNIKNIKLEIIIINDDLKDYEHELKTLEIICSKSKYIIINTDFNLMFNFSIKNQNIIITYGLNQKSTVTVSSIIENSILIYLQRNIKNINEKTIEVGEELINMDENSKLKIYEILVIYIINIVYDIPIIFKT